MYASPCAHSSHHTDTPSQPPSQPDIGHIEPGPPRPSDSCPHTCAVFSQNANGLGGRRDDKLEKLISLMIENSISAYCLQETWQLCNFMLTIQGYSVFYHGMMEKPHCQGGTSAAVMIILNPALTQAWSRAGKLKPITSPPCVQVPWTDDWNYSLLSQWVEHTDQHVLPESEGRHQNILVLGVSPV